MIGAGGLNHLAEDDGPSINHSGAEDILNARPRSLEDDKHSDSNYFGLNIVRSQSAAPGVYTGASLGGNSSRLPYGSISSTRSATSNTIDDENAIFGRSRFFDEEEEDREALMQSAARRPASTGVIGRPTNDSSDVNSILQTLGLAPSSDYSSESNEQEISSRYSNKPLGGIGSSGSIMGQHTPRKQSIMEKIQGGVANSMQSNYFTSEESGNIFSNQGGVSIQSGPQLGLQSNIPRSPMASNQHNMGQYSSSEVRFSYPYFILPPQMDSSISFSPFLSIVSVKLGAFAWLSYIRLWQFWYIRRKPPKYEPG